MNPKDPEINVNLEQQFQEQINATTSALNIGQPESDIVANPLSFGQNASNNGNKILEWNNTTFNVGQALSLQNRSPLFNSEELVNQWQYNFQTVLGPSNPAFVDAETIPGYNLEYNSNNVLCNVTASGDVHPVCADKFHEQNRVIEAATNMTVAQLQTANYSQQQTPHYLKGRGSATTTSSTWGIGGGSEADSKNVEIIIKEEGVRQNVLDWAYKEIGSTAYGQQASLGNVPSGLFKCNIFVGNAYTKGGGIDNFPTTVSPVGHEYPVSVDYYERNWPGKQMGSFVQVASPLPGDIVLFQRHVPNDEQGGPVMIVGYPKPNGEPQFIGAGEFKVELRPCRLCVRSIGLTLNRFIGDMWVMALNMFILRLSGWQNIRHENDIYSI